MNRTCFILLLLSSLLCGTKLALASPPSELARSCVAASLAGQTERDEGRLLAAREQLLSCARDECPAIVKKSCGEWLAELDQRLPSVVVRVFETGKDDLTDAHVTIDGSPVALDGRPVLLDPGPHKIAVEASGWLPVERSFLLAEREQARLLTVQLPRRVEAESPAEPTAAAASISSSSPDVAAMGDGRGTSVPVGAWVTGGVGVAALVGFAVLGSKALKERDELDECAPNCSEAQSQHGERLAIAADVSLAIGIAGVVGAGAWTLGRWLRRRASRSNDRAAAASLLVSPMRTGLLIGARF